MGDKGGKKDKEKLQKQIIKKKEDKAKRANEKNHSKPA
jgi:hypothetical protein